MASNAGGPVLQPKPFIVGERRPELFVPNRPGTIIPKPGADADG